MIDRKPRPAPLRHCQCCDKETHHPVHEGSSSGWIEQFDGLTVFQRIRYCEECHPDGELDFSLGRNAPERGWLTTYELSQGDLFSLLDENRRLRGLPKQSSQAGDPTDAEERLDELENELEEALESV